MTSPRCNSVDYRKRFNRGRSLSDSDSSGLSSGDGRVSPNTLPNLWHGDFSVESVQNLHSFSGSVQDPALALVYVYGDWNATKHSTRAEQTKVNQRLQDQMQQWLRPAVDGLECLAYCGKLCLTEESVDELEQLPPAELPALAIVSQKGHAFQSLMQYLPIKPATLQEAVMMTTTTSNSNNSLVISSVAQSIQQAVRQVESDLQLNVAFEKAQAAVRIFVAGDRSSVGKSSVCLGIIGNLIYVGYEPKDLAYIKPATQSESTQLIQIYCEKKGIACVPIGPLVYYRGFTRAFLAGETPSTDDLLAACGSSVDRLARGKKVVLIDGVGYPAVGSICGTDNASVALACSYPLDNGTRKPASVLLVGGSGVGNAVDSFNLNATYFERAHIPVMGAVFNKLSTDPDNFYSLESCREQVTKYFDQNEHQLRWERRPFGFCPEYDKFKGGNSQTLAFAEEWIKIFGNHVDVAAILSAAHRIKDRPNCLVGEALRPFKRLKIEHTYPSKTKLTRQQIEQAAISLGAPASA